MKTYLLVFSDTIGTSLFVSSLLNQINIISHWRYDISHAIFIKSNSSANEIYREIKERIPNGRFFITEVARENRQGFMTTKTWDFVKGN